MSDRGSKRTSKSRGLVCLLAGLALILFVLVEVAGSGVARAQMRACESHFLNREDSSRLKIVARAMVPTSSVFVVGACRNPGDAQGFVETKKTFTSERVKQWWTISCARVEQDWTCDSPAFKQLTKISIGIGHAKRSVVLAFDQQTSLDHAKSLTSRALAIYSDPAAQLPNCNPDYTNDLRWRSLRWQYRRQFEHGAIDVTVYREDGLDTVTLDDISVNIRFPIDPDEASASNVCWEEFIVVT
jgi:hypothetical protein